MALYVNHHIITYKDLDRTLFVEPREKEELSLSSPQFLIKNSKKSLHVSDSGDKSDPRNLDKSDRSRKNSSKISDKWKIKGSNVSNLSQTSSAKKEDSFRNFNGI